MTATRIPDQFGNRWQYHSRSDRHSKIACWAAFFDLLNTSALLRAHVADGITVVRDPPAPSSSDDFHYDQMIRRLGHIYDSWFQHI